VSPTTPTRNPAIRIVGLRKRFGDHLALDNVSFEVAAGEVVAILGASGAGKTTLFRCLTRLAQPDCGQVFLGEGTVKLSESKLGRSRVGRVNGRDEDASRLDLRRPSLPS
jgi:ABC-type multidrug transport system ATPase subunit